MSEISSLVDWKQIQINRNKLTGPTYEYLKKLREDTVNETKKLLETKKDFITRQKTVEVIGLAPSGKLPSPLKSEVAKMTLRGDESRQVPRVQSYDQPTGEVEKVFPPTVIKALVEIPNIISIDPNNLSCLEYYTNFILSLADPVEFAKIFPQTKLQDVQLDITLVKETLDGGFVTSWSLKSEEMEKGAREIRKILKENIGVRQKGNVIGTWDIVTSQLRNQFEQERQVIRDNNKMILPFIVSSATQINNRPNNYHVYSQFGMLCNAKDPWVHLPISYNSQPCLMTEIKSI